MTKARLQIEGELRVITWKRVPDHIYYIKCLQLCNLIISISYDYKEVECRILLFCSPLLIWRANAVVNQYFEWPHVKDSPDHIVLFIQFIVDIGILCKSSILYHFSIRRLLLWDPSLTFRFIKFILKCLDGDQLGLKGGQLISTISLTTYMSIHTLATRSGIRGPWCHYV